MCESGVDAWKKGRTSVTHSTQERHEREEYIGACRRRRGARQLDRTNPKRYPWDESGWAKMYTRKAVGTHEAFKLRRLHGGGVDAPLSH